MNTASQKWNTRLVEAILADNGDPIIRERLDLLVRWLAGVKNPETQSISLELNKRDTGEDEARQLALVVLDPILFRTDNSPWQVLGIESGASRKEVKERYYWLNKIYHPDRQLSDEAWLTERAERINGAYGSIKKGVAQPDSDQGYSARAASPTATTTTNSPGKEPSANIPSFGDWLRTTLGDARVVERNTMVALTIIAVSLLSLLYWQQDEPYVASITSAGNKEDPDREAVDPVQSRLQEKQFVSSLSSTIENKASQSETTDSVLTSQRTTEIQARNNLDTKQDYQNQPEFNKEISGQMVAVKEQPASISKPETRSDLEVDTTARLASQPPKQPEVTRITVVAKQSETENQLISDSQDSQQYLNKKMHFFLTRFQKSYAEGDIASLGDLFAIQAVQGTLQGRESIIKYYERFFRLTDTQKIFFQQMDARQDDADIRVRANYMTDIRYRGGKLERIRGNAAFRIALENGQVLIKSVEF